MPYSIFYKDGKYYIGGQEFDTEASFMMALVDSGYAKPKRAFELSVELKDGAIYRITDRGLKKQRA